MGKTTLRGYMLAIMGPMMFEDILMHENVQKFINDTSQEFDVVVSEWFFTNMFAGFAALYKVPLVWMSSMDPHWQVLEVIDEPSNAAYTAGVLTTVVPPFSFLERVEELFSQLYMKPILFISHYVLERPIYNKCFGPAFEVRGAVAPPYSSVAYNASFMFFNGQAVLSTGYRLTQNTRYIGGYHIDPDTKPLPENLKKILDDAKYGVIYFSMGSNLKSIDMHETAIEGLVKLFRTLKQTVIWKFEAEMKDLPPNLHILKWAPQPSILKDCEDDIAELGRPIMLVNGCQIRNKKRETEMVACNVNMYQNGSGYKYVWFMVIGRLEAQALPTGPVRIGGRSRALSLI
ncbi:Ecdysteroid UDP-glucosyltransferase [Eumeta japonica]|uniref:Ecdysteroid UDP-glucosyltransferase n=1 Tax=Eumeta variegata TaxID=151549 RepID=A0A4C1VSQ9_EUMVA|nr:Ecdysteroid UDP-glucosyltransferase [Eumeta japonica]